MRIRKRCFWILSILVGTVLLAAAGLVIFLSVTEYRPEPTEKLEISGASVPLLDQTSFTVLSWNIGYCALGEESDFFMDGGEQVRPGAEELVRKNLNGIQRFLSNQDTDFILLQEVDAASRRSYDVDESAALREEQTRVSAYALNFSCNFVPYPWPPIGQVRSGLLTTSRYAVSDAERISLPCPFSWPVSTVNLKRCLLVSRIPVEGTDRELVMVNLHLEAYDSGEGKEAQTRQLQTLLRDEYGKGNYVIAGGDFNQLFSNTDSPYPVYEGMWQPGIIDADAFAGGFSLLMDPAVPTCRSLDRAYAGADPDGFQFYMIDGFIVSENVRVDGIETVDKGFANSDHNPVQLRFTLEEDIT